MEKEWDFKFPNDEEKIKLLALDFLNDSKQIKDVQVRLYIFFANKLCDIINLPRGNIMNNRCEELFNLQKERLRKWKF